MVHTDTPIAFAIWLICVLEYPCYRNNFTASSWISLIRPFAIASPSDTQIYERLVHLYIKERLSGNVNLLHIKTLSRVDLLHVNSLLRVIRSSSQTISSSISIHSHSPMDILYTSVFPTERNPTAS